MNKKFSIVLSKGKNIPCMWEEGGFDGEKGSAVIICDLYGRYKKPLFTKKNSPLKEHALIPVRVKDIIITANIEKDSKTVNFVMYGIKSINEETSELETVELNKTEKGDWVKPLFEKYNYAVKAAKNKVTKLNCDRAFYIKREERREMV